MNSFTCTETGREKNNRLAGQQYYYYCYCPSTLFHLGSLAVSNSHPESRFLPVASMVVFFNNPTLLTLFLFIQAALSEHDHKLQLAVPPPLPLLPLPSYSQLKWQQRELIMFLHFGINTLTDSEWGTGNESPSLFNPSHLDPRQWLRVAADSGFSLVLLTAKHHDGFCLWPSKFSHHSVATTPWKNGGGDVVREFVDAAKHAGLDSGLYLSPWDLHDPSYGNEKKYNEFYLAQLHELLHRYGSIREIWFDGAKGSNATHMKYHFQEWFSMVKQLQRSINIFSDAGPDVRWVGNELGFAGSTSWSTINNRDLSIGNSSSLEYLRSGDEEGKDWNPPECDVSIREGWFWHREEKPKKLSELLNIYYKSVGRNCVMLINVPPNTTGVISEEDACRLRELREAIDEVFGREVAENCSVWVSSERGRGYGGEKVVDGDNVGTYWAPEEGDGEPWVELRKRGMKFNVVRIQEAIGLGQRIRGHEVYADGKMVARGETVGYKRLHRLEGGVVEADAVRIVVKGTRGGAVPLISSIGLHFDPFFPPPPPSLLPSPLPT